MDILLIDDHALFRAGLKILLGGLYDPMTIHEAGSIEHALAVTAEQQSLALILMDLNLPGRNGMDSINLMRLRCPGTPVVVLSGVDDETTVLTALRQGAQGFIPKAADPDTLLTHVRRVLAGGTCWPQVRQDEPSFHNEILNRGHLHLTGRQIDVLTELAKGASNKEIARDLGMSDNTVRTHLAVIFRTLDAHSRAEAIFRARQKSLI